MGPNYWRFNLEASCIQIDGIPILQCFEMLECLGLPCIWAPGEAEAYCAWLNSHGVRANGCFHAFYFMTICLGTRQ